MYSILTPYIIPKGIYKIPNIGDALILEAVKNLLHPSIPEYIFSTRIPLNDSDNEKINSTKALIIAGSNQLSDNFNIANQTSFEIIKKIKVPIIPFGLGITGISNLNRSLSKNTQNILRFIHKDLKYSSWRCPLTIDYLIKFLPDLKDKFLMTSCPVLFGFRNLKDEDSNSQEKIVLITITERGDWFEREKNTIDFILDNFKNNILILSIHQNYLSKNNVGFDLLSLFHRENNERKRIRSFHEFAKDNGIKVFYPNNVNELISVYLKCDTHFGSRLHAHLFFLGLSKKSLLTYVDDRVIGFSESIGFPIINSKNFQGYMKMDFESIIKNIDNIFNNNMRTFVNYLNNEVL